MTDETTSPVLWECPDCGKVLKNQAGLISHLKTHVKLPPEPQPTPRFDYVPEDEILGDGSDLINISGDLSMQGGANSLTGNAFNVSPVCNTGAALSVPGQIMTGVIGGQTHDLHVKVKRLPHYGNLPELRKATSGSAAFDLYAAIDEDIVIGIDDWHLIPTGICMEIPPGWWGLCAPRSGLAAKDGITVLNTPGVIDSDYRGEIKVNLVNHTTKKFVVKPGMRICQIMFLRSYDVEMEVVEELSNTIRGDGGFGSTGSF